MVAGLGSDVLFKLINSLFNLLDLLVVFVNVLVDLLSVLEIVVVVLGKSEVSVTHRNKGCWTHDSDDKCSFVP